MSLHLNARDRHSPAGAGHVGAMKSRPLPPSGVIGFRAASRPRAVVIELPFKDSDALKQAETRGEMPPAANIDPRPAKPGRSPTIAAFMENEVALKRFLSRMLPTESDVEDVAQETFIRAYAAAATQTVLMPKAFLFRIAKNLALNERSRMWNTTTTFVGDAAELDDLCSDDGAVSGEDRLDSHRKMKLLEEAIAQLPAQCRRVFQLRKIEEFSHKEIAAQMGITVSTVEKHIATGLVRCKKYLADHGYAMGPARPMLAAA